MTHKAAIQAASSHFDQLDELCDAFEAQWQRGERPSIRRYLAEVEKIHWSESFREFLLVELEFRQQLGEWPSRHEYLRDYPEFAAQIEATLVQYGTSAFATLVNGTDDTICDAHHQPGQRIGQFQLLERLGAGAMGEVWKARDPRLQRDVAIKFPRIQFSAASDLRRFLREGQAAAQLHHAQLATIHEVGRVGDTVFIVSDFVDGENLRQYQKSHALDYEAMAELNADIADALGHAHEKGVVHRDLKPANVIVTAAGQPHVIDFGLAKWSSDDHDLTMQGELLGTPAYMSPELASGDGAHADYATDIYSLGVILYEMLTGSCPFTGERSAVLHQINSCEPPPPRKRDRRIPRDLETICLKALEKDPRRRYPAIREMAADLHRFACGEPIRARRLGLWERNWRRFRRRPALAAALLMAIIALVAVSAAGTLVKKNRQLLGYKTVLVVTDPPGAKIAYARLTESGELLPGGVFKPNDTTPLQTELMPSDYFVEVLWPDGRFQQVLRTVPNSSDTSYAPVSGHHRRFKINTDGSIQLPTIKIPAEEVTKGMTFVPMSSSSLNGLTNEKSPMKAPFWVDRADVTVGQVRTVNRGDLVGNLVADKEPVRATYDEAVDIAEALGKRLATSYEYGRLLIHDRGLARSNAPSLNSASTTMQRPISGVQGPAATGVDRPVFVRYPVIIRPGTPIRCVRSSHPLLLDNK